MSGKHTIMACGSIIIADRNHTSEKCHSYMYFVFSPDYISVTTDTMNITFYKNFVETWSDTHHWLDNKRVTRMFLTCLENQMRKQIKSSYE